jgi:hypothetical protein
MTSHPTISKGTGKRALAKLFGVAFICLSLIASALTTLLPHGSSAASSTIVVGPAVDTYVRQSTPTDSFAVSSQIAAVGGGDARIALLRFNISGIPAGTTVQSAKLRLVVTNDSTSGGIVAGVSNNTWPENVTWSAKPAADGPQLGQFGAVAVGQAVEADVTSYVKGNGVYSVAISSPANVTNTVAYASRENGTAASRPQLTLVLQSGATAPTSTTAPTSQPQPTTAPTSAPAPTPVPSGNLSLLATTVQVGPGYMGSGAELSARRQLAAQGVEPYKSAVSNVVGFANGKLSTNPSPQEPLNIPDTSGPFVDDTATAYGLALAYQATGNVKYAQKSREFIMAWVQKTKTTANTCPDSGACQTSLIIGRVAPGFVFAAQLIKPSGALTSADDQAFKTWLRNVILPTASVRINNWGDAGTFMRAAVTDYIGDTAGFNAAVAKWKSLVDLIAADGHIPEETRRGTSGLNYTQEALDYKIAVAVIAQRRGIDLWSYGRFKLAVDYAAKYVVNPSSWPWSSGASASIHPLWEIAYQRWKSPAYKPIIQQRRPYGADGHSAVRWTTLTNGIPF